MTPPTTAEQQKHVAEKPATERREPAALADTQTLMLCEEKDSPESLASPCDMDKKSVVVEEISPPDSQAAEEAQHEPEVTSSGTSVSFPQYKRDLKTRKQCIIATIVGAVLSVFCFTSGLVIALRDPHHLALRLPIPIQDNWNEAISLGINLVLGFANDGMAFAHSCSLRWALLAERRLEYNTNVRLFTHARVSPPNRWPANVLSATSLVLCYGASSLVIVGGEPEDRGKDIVCWDLGFQTESQYSWVNATALCALGIGLGIQAALAGWCLYISMPRKGTLTTSTVPSWNSNPLNTTLAALHMGIVTHRSGRAMLSAHQHEEPSGGARPQPRQRSMWALRQRSIRIVLILVWTYAFLAVSAPLLVIFLPKTLSCVFCFTWSNQCPGAISEDWSYDHKNFMYFSMGPTDRLNKAGLGMTPYFWQCFLAVVYVCCFQGTQTCGLHAIELLVNMSRDETAWRRAGSANGSRPGSGGEDSLIAAVKSWENGVLFVAKAVLHWIIGESLMPTINPDNSKFWLCAAYSRLLIYALLAISTALFATYIAMRRYRGPQPAALGKLETLADLVDDWRTDEKGRFWWGDKTPPSGNVEVRHAGTSRRKDEVGVISLHVLYE